jgi:hypothetical protein
MRNDFPNPFNVVFAPAAIADWRAEDRDGSSRATSSPMIEITTSNSTSVKPLRDPGRI